MKHAIVVFVLLSVVHTVALDKSQFDISITPDESQGGALLAKSMHFGSQLLKNNVTEISLMTGGYFTIGTQHGVSETLFDDHCNLTFGHPYALTSYPLLSIDGHSKRLDQWFQEWSPIAPQSDGGRLFVQAQYQDKLQIEFILHPTEGGRAVDISCSVKNIDNIPHTLGMGLVYDAALVSCQVNNVG